MNKTLENKIALVTGGAQGLGAAIVEHLAEEGCDIVAWDVNAEKVQETAAEIARKSGRRVSGQAVDVTNAEAVRLAMDDAAADAGRTRRARLQRGHPRFEATRSRSTDPNGGR